MNNTNLKRLVSDNHELALVGAKFAVAETTLSFDKQVSLGVQYAKMAQSDSRKSFPTFRIHMGKWGVIDLINNSQGRKYWNTYGNQFTGMEAFDDVVKKGVLVLSDTSVTSTHETTAWNSFQ